MPHNRWTATVVQSDALHILFHPDCNRRPWPLTRSADLHGLYGALAGSPEIRDTAGGEFHPALRIHTESRIYLPYGSVK